MARRSKSSGGRGSALAGTGKNSMDPFAQRAKLEGWRSRAVFKLEEIDRRDKLLKAGAVCLDLGAAPGAWSQYARRKLGKAGTVIAVDVLKMEPLEGVRIVQGDLREEAVFASLLALAPERQVDVVLSDLAPNMSGVEAIDQPRAMHLSQRALQVAERVLKPGGSALIKVFQGAGFQELVEASRGRFGRVRLTQPRACGSRSPEMYLLAKEFRLV
jgi:23S rRNA (uridine2552-2'-O)-methyltransferase